MKFSIIATALATIALFGASGAVFADQLNDYSWHNSLGLYPWNPNWDPNRFNCRVVNVRTTNRWGNDVTISRRVCD